MHTTSSRHFFFLICFFFFEWVWVHLSLISLSSSHASLCIMFSGYKVGHCSFDSKCIMFSCPSDIWNMRLHGRYTSKPDGPKEQAPRLWLQSTTQKTEPLWVRPVESNSRSDAVIYTSCVSDSHLKLSSFSLMWTHQGFTQSGKWPAVAPWNVSSVGLQTAPSVGSPEKREKLSLFNPYDLNITM